MNLFTDELYERFKKNLESVNGSCVRTSVSDLGKTLAGLLKELELWGVKYSLDRFSKIVRAGLSFRHSATMELRLASLEMYLAMRWPSW